MRSERSIKNKQLRNKRIFEAILSVFILIAVFLGGLTGYYGSKIASFLDGISESEEVSADNDSLDVLKGLADAEPFAALILGTDIEEGGQARSDTIIVVTINPNEESIKLLSIPRDTLIMLPDGTIEKMNATYGTGGGRLSSKMVGEMFDIPINLYASLDFRGLVELVDAVGGITVNSDLEFMEENLMDYGNPVQIQKGIQNLNGAEVLGYTRMRMQDPRGDFGRQDRQKEVIIEILNELYSFNTITNLTDILNAVKPYMKTNASTSQMLSIAANYSNALNEVEQLHLDGFSSEKYFPHYDLEVYVWEPYEESIFEISQELRKHLELESNPETEIIDRMNDDFE